MRSLAKLFVYIMVAVGCIAGSPTSMAQKKTTPQESDLGIGSWNALQGVPLFLISYGLYDNGRRVNESLPSSEGFKEGEILTDEFGGLKWWKVVTGNRKMDIKFNAKVDGMTLYTSSPEEDITWIKMLEVWENNKKYFLYTVDNRNTYRVHLIDTDTMNKLFMKGFFEGLMK